MKDTNDSLMLPLDYGDWLADLKLRIQGAQSRAVLAMNEEQIRLYHSIGCEILERRSRQGWGSKAIERLSSDLREAFPDMKGLSSRNLKYMSVFAKQCPDCQIGQQTAAQLPWFHIVMLLTKVEDSAQREWYAMKAVAERWSRSTLEVQIKNHLYDRQGVALTNFDRAYGAISALATILSDLDTEIASLETKLTKTRQLKQGMMHELLTGRIRLL